MTVLVEDLGRCAFRQALDRMDLHLDCMHRGVEPEHVLVFESEPVITLGRDARRANLLATEEELRDRGVPLLQVQRGGDATWHGPGQLVLFPLVDLHRRERDVYWLVDLLVGTVRDTLACYGISIDPPNGEIGAWVGGYKVASMGLRHRRGIASHGMSLNVNPALEWVDWINPCGDARRRVTSLERLLDPCPRLEEVKEVLLERLLDRLGDEAPGRCAVLPGTSSTRGTDVELRATGSKDG